MDKDWLIDQISFRWLLEIPYKCEEDGFLEKTV